LTAFDYILGGVPRFAAEAAWARRLIERQARELRPQSQTRLWGRHPLVRDAAGRAPLVLIQADPEAYLLPAAAHRLLAVLEREECPVALPVTNEPWSDETRCAPPFAYHTPSLLSEAVAFVAAQTRALRRAEAPVASVFAARREVLRALPADLPLEGVPREAVRLGFSAWIDSGAYVHRYAEMDGQARGDLAAKVPPGARAVLDVGCARGVTAAILRSAGVARVVGIEPDPADAAEAARACDRVIRGGLEETMEDFPGEFDAILFGDVLEHMPDPAAALAKVRSWLSPRGALIASVPNLGHWSVIADLLEGRFDYVPYSILSGTHIRFFTRRTLVDLFEASGYRVETIETVTFPPSPLGARKLAALQAMPGASPDLEAAEFIAVAKADS
jgi:2-polyprenyl-3-methyl-5-hydroxy-6-metoxy-1,4-benzoquinol methylase